MKLRYETGVATMIQFVVIGLLNLVYAVYTSIHSCVKGLECGTNTILAVAYFMLLGLWFLFICALGYAAQNRRSKRLSQLLIISEVLVALIALFNSKHYTDLFGLVISLVDVAFAVWIITLAFRLMRSEGGRIRVKATSRTRTRKRPATGPHQSL